MWQDLRSELYPRGLEIVTVALDTGGADAARRWIEAARPEHPSLIDRGHLTDELFGIVNVPSGIWIDEAGTIVRPPETAYPRRPAFLDREIPANASPRVVAQITEVKKLRIEAEKYVAALRDWVAHGAASRYALPPEEVVLRNRPRPVEEALAATHFALGHHLHDAGRAAGAVPHYREAIRLQPENWTYKRQAWNLAGSAEAARELYGSDWLADVRALGAENYYPPLELE